MHAINLFDLLNFFSQSLLYGKSTKLNKLMAATALIIRGAGFNVSHAYDALPVTPSAPPPP